MNEIDLSKLTIKQPVTKNIKANFDGTEKDFTISALSEPEQSEFQEIVTDSEDVLRRRKAYIFLLVCGLSWEQNAAAIVYEYANAEALRVANEIWEFTQSLNKEKQKTAEDAEKNSPPAAETAAAN